MNNKNRIKKIEKYTSLYMSLGMCFGMIGGLIYGEVLSENSTFAGIPTGVLIGMCAGLIIGAVKDEHLAKKMMEIINIEKTSCIVIIYVKNLNGVEKKYEVSENNMKHERFRIGDRVAELTDGSLVSLESK